MGWAWWMGMWAAAASVPVELVYQRGPGAAGCPDHATLEKMVSTRLGYNPWSADGPRVMELLIQKEETGLVAHLELRQRHGALLGQRQLVTPNDDCDELTAAATLAMSLAVDPLAGLNVHPRRKGAAPSPSRPLPSATLPWKPRRLSPILVPYNSRRVAWGMGFGGIPAGGFSVEAGATWRSLSAGMELHMTTPVWLPVAGGVVAARAADVLWPICYAPGFLRACGLMGAGLVNVWDAGGANLPARTIPHMLVGARLGVRMPVARGIAVDATLDSTWVSPRIRLRAQPQNTTDWLEPPANLTAQLGMAFTAW